jgi:SAM-dependent methyltransferase
MEELGVMNCRHCRAELSLLFIDLGTAPPSNSYLSRPQLSMPEKWYPLRVYTCTRCWLVQTEDFAHYADLFADDYAYFSSYSSSWVSHAKDYVNRVAERFGLTRSSFVVEVASNDGYLLQFVRDRGISCIGIEPTESTAQEARLKGIDVVQDFFGTDLAKKLVSEGRSADLTVANNVLAHVPDINDFVSGFARILKADGVATFEFPHLLKLERECQFDTIYHEHFSYLSLTTVSKIFTANGLSIFDVEEISTHGGSLRVFAQRLDTGRRDVLAAVNRVLAEEVTAGMTTEGFYRGFQTRAQKIKNDFIRFLIQMEQNHKKVAGYGAAAKGNTLLNFCGIRSDLLPWVVDRNPAKSGKFLPGSRIPIVGEDRLRTDRPDFIVILPWNIKAEVIEQLAYVRDWGARFACAIPKLIIQ